MKRGNVSIIVMAIFVILGGIFFLTAPEASALEASTTLTVVNVTKWYDPDCTDYIKHDDIIHSATFSPGVISWTWEPKWPPYYNGVSAIIWFVYSIDQFGNVSNEGKQWAAMGWDMVGNHTTSKYDIDNSIISDWTGLMFTTVCGATEDCSTQKTKERSNIMFTQNPY